MLNLVASKEYREQVENSVSKAEILSQTFFYSVNSTSIDRVLKETNISVHSNRAAFLIIEFSSLTNYTS